MRLNLVFLFALLLALPASRSTVAQSPEALFVPEQDEVMDVEVDAGVTDPRGDDEGPSPREDNYVCDAVVCGDETRTCATCPKTDR